MMPWHKVGVCSVGIVDIVDRFCHAGLSIDGSLCFVGDVDDVYFVWDIDRAKVIWFDDGAEGEAKYPVLDSWVNDGTVGLDDTPAVGHYRIFGLYHNYARTKEESLNIELKVSARLLFLCDAYTGEELQRLEYEEDSGDWVFASFSDDGSTIAVLEPYNVTFFRQTGAETAP